MACKHSPDGFGREQAVRNGDSAGGNLAVELNDVRVERAAVGVALHEDVARLAEPMDAASGLHLGLRIEARLHQIDARRGGEGDADVTHLHRRHEHLRHTGAARLDRRLEAPNDAGAAALAKACRQLPKLKELSLYHNQIGDAGMAALAEAIAKEGAFPSLTKLALPRNPASKEATNAVQEALEKKQQQQRI